MKNNIYQYTWLKRAQNEGFVIKLGNFPYHPSLRDKARQLRKKMTHAEKKLWYKFLRNSKFKFYRQRPIDHYIVDFFCSKAKLVIELDGNHHKKNSIKCYDENRDEILRSYGLAIIRIPNDKIENSFDEVCDKINSYLIKVALKQTE
ncbi:MAG: endonuclease domain-containing protein [Candidatus Zixiibacteriota bacterium]